MNLILASSSPRRKELIKMISDLEIEVFPSLIDESLYVKDILPQNIAVELAVAKANYVYNIKQGLVLGADTLINFNGKILGKPKDKYDAYRMFQILCDNTHEVITGICITNGEKTVKNYQISYVSFNSFDKSIIDNYIDSGLCFGKAGGYGIQDNLIKPLIREVKGDIYNVIGLPIALVKKILEDNFSYVSYSDGN